MQFKQKTAYQFGVIKTARLVVFVLSFVLSSLVLLSCQLVDNRIRGSYVDSPSQGGNLSKPTVEVSAPLTASGDQATDFDFDVTYTDADTLNLTPAQVTVNTTGSVVCDTPVTVTSGTTSTPTVRVTHCVGTGTVGISINAGTSSNTIGSDEGSIGSQTASVSLTCPTNYIPVVHNDSYTTTDFCVMKYEAKLWHADDVSGDNIVDDGNFSNAYDYDTDYETPADLAKYQAVSSPSGRPWVRIKRGENGAATGQGALEACQELGTGYDLITNDQWQTISRDIELVATNWEEGVVGGTSSAPSVGTDANQLNHGHADNDPGQSCDASNEYVDTDCLDSGSEADFAEKRTHDLSNGEVVWDLAGNAWEWVKDNNTNAYGGGDYLSQITVLAPHDNLYSLAGGTTTTPRNAKDQFGPVGDYTSLSAGNNGGLGYLSDSSAGAVLRGGGWNNGSYSGVFRANLYNAPTYSNSDISFRCVSVP